MVRTHTKGTVAVITDNRDVLLVRASEDFPDYIDDVFGENLAGKIYELCYGITGLYSVDIDVTETEYYLPEYCCYEGDTSFEVVSVTPMWQGVNN